MDRSLLARSAAAVASAAQWAGTGQAPAVTIRFPPNPARIRDVRRVIEAAVLRAGLDERAAGELTVATGEALSNAVLHGAAPDAGAVIQARCWVQAEDVIVEVRSPRTGWRAEPAPGTTPGFGLELMRVLSDACDVRQDRHGTVVTLRKRRRPLATH